MIRLVLKPERDKSVRHRHPWVFSGAIARRSGPLTPGATVEVFSAEGAWLASLEFEATELQPQAVLRRPGERPLWLYRAPFIESPSSAPLPRPAGRRRRR